MQKNYTLIVLVTSLLSIATLSSALAQNLTDEAFGYWVNKNGWLIETASCKDGICGIIVGMREDAEEALRFDSHNPDPNLRRRSLCGITIFGAFKPSRDPGEWEDGWIYNPQDGKTYSSVMELGKEDSLEVRGYVLNPMFGRTVVLVRGEMPAAPCGANKVSEQREASTE